jgi:hypothetical protein
MNIRDYEHRFIPSLVNLSSELPFPLALISKGLHSFSPLPVIYRHRSILNTKAAFSGRRPGPSDPNPLKTIDLGGKSTLHRAENIRP